MARSVLLELCTTLDKCTSFQWGLVQMSILSSPVQVFAMCLTKHGEALQKHFICFFVGQNAERFSIIFPSLCLVGIQLWLFKVRGRDSGFWLFYCAKNCRSKLSNSCLLNSVLLNPYWEEHFCQL